MQCNLLSDADPTSHLKHQANFFLYLTLFCLWKKGVGGLGLLSRNTLCNNFNDFQQLNTMRDITWFVLLLVFEFPDISFYILRGLLLICSGVLLSVSATIVSRWGSKSKKIQFSRDKIFAWIVYFIHNILRSQTEFQLFFSFTLKSKWCMVSILPGLSFQVWVSENPKDKQGKLWRGCYYS